MSAKLVGPPPRHIACNVTLTMNNDKKPQQPKVEEVSDGQSGAKSGNAAMKQKPGATPKGVNADANDDTTEQNGARVKSGKEDVRVHDEVD